MNRVILNQLCGYQFFLWNAFRIIFEKQFITSLHKTKGLRLTNTLNRHGFESRICKDDRMPNIDMFIGWDTTASGGRNIHE